MSNVMKMSGRLKLTTPSDTEILMVREFAASRRLVYDALTKPDLVSRWLGVFGGHTMAVCEIDLRVGGRYRYVWTMPEGGLMGMGGVFQEIVPDERIVVTERFEDAWYPGEAINVTTLAEETGRTTMSLLVRYESKEARDAVLKSGMETGVDASYDTLDGLLASLR
jgi:uncharacterized protein YndB with AHSA1/START domain